MKTILKWIFFTLATFIERYDSFHGTTAHKGTEPKQVDTTEKTVETSDENTATPEKSTKEAPESSMFLDSLSMYRYSAANFCFNKGLCMIWNKGISDKDKSC